MTRGWNFLRWLVHSDKHPFETVVMIVSLLLGISTWFIQDSAPSIEDALFKQVWSAIIAVGGATNIFGWVLTYKRLLVDGALLEQIGMGMVGFCLTVYGVNLFANNGFDNVLVIGALCLGLGLGCYFRLWQVRGLARSMAKRIDESG